MTAVICACCSSDNQREERLPNAIPQIVTEKLFEQVRKRMAKNKKSPCATQR
ncbi:MAG: recombinase family protein [Oscillospiraceae bacterium]|nr:recombinase family protein [Oscillospiraceae bacterium]